MPKSSPSGCRTSVRLAAAKINKSFSSCWQAVVPPQVAIASRVHRTDLPMRKFRYVGVDRCQMPFRDSLGPMELRPKTVVLPLASSPNWLKVHALS